MNDNALADLKAIPILDVARKLEIPLFREGNTWSARCLKKGEADTKPSLKFWLGKNRWKCFSCGEGGDVIELVQQKQECTFHEAVTWLREVFDIGGDDEDLRGDLLARWANLRGVRVESVRAFGAVAAGNCIRFPMRVCPGGEIVGWQRRHADNTEFSDKEGGRSRCAKDSRRGLFLPLAWPARPSEDEVFLCVEGEPDSVTGHSLGVACTVGTSGKLWSPDVAAALQDLARPFLTKVMILHGDVPDEDLFGRAAELKAKVVRVPVYVSHQAGKRDLNEWLKADREAKVRQAILADPSFMALLHSAIPDIERAVQMTSRLQPRDKAILRCLVVHLLQQVLPVKQRNYRGVVVGPGQWVTTLAELAGETGGSKQAVRTCLDKLRRAGVLDWENLGGQGGIRIGFYNLSEFVRTTPRTFGLDGLTDGLQGISREEVTPPGDLHAERPAG